MRLLLLDKPAERLYDNTPTIDYNNYHSRAMTAVDKDNTEKRTLRMKKGYDTDKRL